MNLKLFFDRNDITEDEFKRLKFDAAYNTLADGDQKSASAKIREAIFCVMGIDPSKFEDGNVPMKTIRRAYKKNKIEVFEVIEDVVEDKLTSGWKDSEWFQRFVDMRNLALGDKNQFWADKKVYLTVNRMSGNHHDVSIQRLGEGESYSVNVTTYVASVGTDIELFLAGRRDWNELIDAVYYAFDKKVKDSVYAEVINVGAKLPSNSQFHKTSPLNSTTKETFDTLIDDVSTANDSSPVIIMGTRTAISKVANLTDIDWVSSEMKNEKNRTGRIGYYEGHTLMEIPQRFAPGDTTTKLVDPNKVLIIPETMDKFVKFVDVGDGEILEVTERGDRVDDTMIFEYQRTMGVSAIIGQYFGVWDITG